MKAEPSSPELFRATRNAYEDKRSPTAVYRELWDLRRSVSGRTSEYVEFLYETCAKVYEIYRTTESNDTWPQVARLLPLRSAKRDRALLELTKFVFEATSECDRKRASKIAAALKYALCEDVPVAHLSQFIRDAGGLEALARRTAKAGRPDSGQRDAGRVLAWVSPQALAKLPELGQVELLATVHNSAGRLELLITDVNANQHSEPAYSPDSYAHDSETTDGGLLAVTDKAA